MCSIAVEQAVEESGSEPGVVLCHAEKVALAEKQTDSTGRVTTVPVIGGVKIRQLVGAL
jgi:hypothetical protein